MKHLLFLPFFLLLAHPAKADIVSDYVAMASESAAHLTGVAPGDIAGELARQEALLELGRNYAKDFAAKFPDVAPLMTFVVESSYEMPKMTLPEIEAAWHEGGALEAAGFDNTTHEHFGVLNSIGDMMVHPATVIILLHEYEDNGDDELLAQGKFELEEVLEHVKHLM